MFNPHSMVMSPVGKREFTDDVECDIAFQTNQLGICSPSAYHNSNKRVRYDHTKLLDNNRTLDSLCSLPCSDLANIDLETYFNMTTFNLLSQEKRTELAQMLPDIDTNYPSPLDSQYDFYETVNPSLFHKNESPVFWKELNDWQQTYHQHPHHNHQQQQQYENDYKEPRNACCKSRTEKYKDEGFESYWGELIDKEKAHNVAGDSKNITLKDMCRKGLIREKDIIQYKRNFSACKVVVSKTMKVIKASGTSGISIKLDDEIFEDFETPTALETKILDHHGQVTKDKRPNGNAFKSIHLIRDGKDLGRLFDIRKDGFGHSN